MTFRLNFIALRYNSTLLHELDFASVLYLPLCCCCWHPTVMTDYGVYHSREEVEHLRMWLKRPILDLQTWQQYWHTKSDASVVSGCLFWLSDLLALFRSYSSWTAFSLLFSPSATRCFHSVLLSANDSHASVSMLHAFKSLLHTSLKRRCGRRLPLSPVASWPYSRSFGMRPSSILRMWLRQRKRRWRNSVNIDGMSALERTSLLVTLSFHVVPRILRRHLRWKVWSFRSWFE